MANEQMHTMNQAAVAALEAAASHVQRRTGPQTLPLLEDEIRILRARGFTDECINGLLTGFDMEVTTEQSGRLRTSPSIKNQLIPLIWGKPPQLHWSSDSYPERSVNSTGPLTAINPIK